MQITNKLKSVLLSDIKPYKNNIKIHTEEQINQIKKSIESNEYIQPICVDKNKIIVIGHGRYFALQQIDPDMEIEVVDLKDLSKQAIKKLRISDNKINESEWDFDNLEKELKLIYVDIEQGMDKIVDDLNFDKDFLGDMVLNSKYGDKEEVEDEVPEVEDNIIKQGDMIELGKHRLLCGDCTIKENVDRLMNGEKADMVFTDPPYGIDYDDNQWEQIRGFNIKTKRMGKIKGDNKNFNPFFILEIFKDIKEIFIWGFQYYPEKLGRGGMIVWIKKTDAQKNMLYGDFEVCWSKKERNKMFLYSWGGFNNKEKNEKQRFHPTQKPVGIIELILNKWGKIKNIVWDGFLGSGSTLIACEKTGRICYGMELAEHYCDVIIQRYCQYTDNWNIKINGKKVKWNNITGK